MGSSHLLPDSELNISFRVYSAAWLRSCSEPSVDWSRNTRHGRPVARLVPNTGGIDQLQARTAAERIRARAQDLKLGRFNWGALKLDRDSGRP